MINNNNEGIKVLTVAHGMSAHDRAYMSPEVFLDAKEYIKRSMARELAEQIIKNGIGEWSETTNLEDGRLELTHSVMFISKEELKRLKEIESYHLGFRKD